MCIVDTKIDIIESWYSCMGNNIDCYSESHRFSGYFVLHLEEMERKKWKINCSEKFNNLIRHR